MMKKNIDMIICEHQVDKMKRQIRREKKLAKKTKWLKQSRRSESFDRLLGWAMLLGYAVTLASCAAVKREDVRRVRDSVATERMEENISEQREEMARALFESFGWAEDRRAALIRSDSGLVFQPDGSFQMQQGTVLLQSARRQENASRSDRELGSSRRVDERSIHEEEATLSVELRERKKKKPPGGMLLIPALVTVFVFLVVVRKVRR